ncbi:MAG: polysaccharide biosynthesis tyrosine autokinase [Chitinivibrionales bacterium]|nr:polysaccharide biosynthesis tyrosine autokinase [Chitinivibrionales bacterium]
MEEKRKRFSLGNIRRKLESDAETKKSPQSNGQHKEPQKNDNAPIPPASPPKNRAPSLPAQPRFGENRDNELTSRGNKRDEELIQPSDPISRPRKPVPETSPESPSTEAAPPQPEEQLSALRHEEEEEEEFDIYQYIGVLLRRKTIIILSTIGLGVFSFFSFLTAPKHYSAQARLLFSPGHREIVSDNLFTYQMWQDREKKVNTHLELLKSDQEVLRRISDALDNKVSPSEIQAGIHIARGETDGEKNNIIQITFSHQDSATARNVVNNLCKEYIAYIEEVNAQDITKMIFKFKDQIEKVSKKLERKEDALKKFKEKNRMVQLSSETNLVLSKLSNMELALQQTKMDLLENKEKFTSIKQQINQQEINIVNAITVEDPYQTRLSELEFQLNSLLADYNPDHYKVKMVQKEIRAMKEVIESSVKTKTVQSETYIKNPIRETLLQSLVNLTTEKSSLEAKRQAQEQIIEKLNSDLQKLPSLEIEYASLQRGTQSLEQTLIMLEDKYEKAKIKRDSQESDLKILELANMPSSPNPTVKKSRVFIGIFIGIILGVALAFLFEFLDQTIKEPRDLEKALEVPLLGIIPHLEEDKPVIDPADNKSKTKLEPFRVLRTNLKHIAKVHHIRTLIICSPVKGEGKTTLAVNLAVTFAMDGKKIILVDGDLRRPQIHGLLETSKETGLSDYILELSGVDDIIKPTRYENLSIITAGERPNNPTELLGTYRFDQLIEDLKERADLVIFDSPALLPVSDALNMAPKMDGCVFVGRSLWTPLKAAKQAKLQLKQIGTKIYGAILNGISHSRGYYPYYYGYYRYYAYKYTYDYDEENRDKKSIREIGLNIESKIKESIHTLKNSWPRLLAQSGRFFGYLGKRWTFWGLLIILTGLTIIGGWLKSRKDLFPTVEKIEYMGPAKGLAPESTSTDIQSSSLQNKGMSLEAASRQIYNSKRRHGSDTLPNTISANPKNDIPSCEDIARRWHDAFLEGDKEHLVTFYDNNDFRFPRGNFNHWQSTILESLTTRARDSKGMIDTMWNEIIDPGHTKVYSTFLMVSQSDTTRLQIAQIWSNENGKWSIIRQKHSVLP